MSIWGGKCPKCWDPYPCSCMDSPEVRQQKETNRQFAEQNWLLRQRTEVPKKPIDPELAERISRYREALRKSFNK